MKRMHLALLVFGCFTAFAFLAQVRHSAAVHVAATPMQFEDIGTKAGLADRLISGGPRKDHVIESMSGGVAFLDYNNDGWQDIFLVNGSTIEAEIQGNNKATDRLYRNNRDLTFTDVTDEAGVRDSAWGMGVCAADVNNDGFVDIFVTNFGPNRLYINKRDGTFRDFSQESGATDSRAWHSSCAFGDYDKDGDLDLYVSGYLEFDVGKLPPILEPRSQYIPYPPVYFNAAPDFFYENLGGGKFRNVSTETGIAKLSPFYGLGVIWGDYDNDGDQDIYVANDMTPNSLLRNNGDKTFSDIGMKSGVSIGMMGMPQASMGVDFADFDNDGDLDLHTTNYSGEYNALYRNEGNSQFTDHSFEAEIGVPSIPFLGWGTRFVDFNLDGWMDLVVANGHVFAHGNDSPILLEQLAGFRQRLLLFANNGGKFAEVGLETAGFGRSIRVSRGLAVGDINNDGQMDLLISNMDETPTLLLNKNTGGNWSMIHLKGAVSNRDAIGARVTMRTGELRQIREVQAGGSYQSQHDLRLHFGLGSSETIDALEIRWPDGHLEKLVNLPSRRVLQFIEKPH